MAIYRWWGWRLLLAAFLLCGLRLSHPALLTDEIPPDRTAEPVDVSPNVGLEPGRVTDEAFYRELLTQGQEELVSKRGRYSKAFQVAPGMRMMRISTSPIHYLDEGGEWHEIDTTLVPSSSRDYDLEAVRNAFKVYFRKDSSSEYLVRYEIGGAEMTFGIEAAQTWGRMRQVEGKATGNQVVYENMFSGIDLRYQLSAQRMLEEFIVWRPEVAERILQIDKRFQAKDVRWELRADGSVGFERWETGERLWSIPRPVMYELGNPLNRSYGLHFEIEEKGGHSALKKVLEATGQAWLNDPERQFPVVIDDTIDLDENDMTAAGDGFVQQQSTTYERVVDKNRNGAGYLDGWVYRSFLEWDVGAIPDDADIQALGLYLYVTDAPAAGTFELVQMNNAVGSYPDNALGNQALFDDIGTETTVYNQLVDEYSNFAIAGVKYVSLGFELYNSPSILDLEDKLADDVPFGIGVRLSDETNGIAIFGAAEAASVEGRPDLVIFYGGVEGSFTKMARPLRNCFWDGNYYWVFFRSLGEVDYYYSADGVSWTRSGQLDDIRTHHHAVWYEAERHTVWAAYHEQGPGYSGDMLVETGNVSGTKISWSAPSPVFGADLSQEEGYDFPSIIRDTNGYCWVTARYYVGTDGAAQRVARSSTPDCIGWDNHIDLVPWRDGISTIRTIGGSLIPLTDGQVYAIYKDVIDLKGRLYDGTSWRPEETIDATTAVGVYTQGFSAVAISDTVHLAYIDDDDDLMYVSWESGWGTPVELGEGTFYSPSLSWDTATDDLYVVYRTDSLHTATGSVYYIRGANPYEPSDWSSAVTLTSASWSPVFTLGPNAAYPVFSNYSGDGTVFAFWVEGIWGLEFGSIISSAKTEAKVHLPIIIKY